MNYLLTLRTHLLESLTPAEPTPETIIPVITIGRMPDTPDVAVTLYENAGGVGLHDITSTSPTWESTLLQIMTRASEYPQAQDLAVAIQNAMRPFMLTTDQMVRIKPKQSPTYVDHDERERVLYSQNFEVWLDRRP